MHYHYCHHCSQAYFNETLTCTRCGKPNEVITPQHLTVRSCTQVNIPSRLLPATPYCVLLLEDEIGVTHTHYHPQMLTTGTVVKTAGETLRSGELALIPSPLEIKSQPKAQS